MPEMMLGKAGQGHQQQHNTRLTRIMHSLSYTKTASSLTRKVSPPTASSSAPPAEAVPAPAAVDEAASHLLLSTETTGDDAPSGFTAFEVVYFLTGASLAFSIDTFVGALLTLPIGPYWHYLPWRFHESQIGMLLVL